MLAHFACYLFEDTREIHFKEKLVSPREETRDFSEICTLEYRTIGRGEENNRGS